MIKKKKKKKKKREFEFNKRLVVLTKIDISYILKIYSMQLLLYEYWYTILKKVEVRIVIFTKIIVIEQFLKMNNQI